MLIGKRDKDEYIPELSWSFPGGRPTYKHSLSMSLRMEIKKKTNLDVNVVDCFFARTLPERPEFLQIYYFCEVTGESKKPKAMEKFKEIKWIKPTEVEKHFTTSIDPVVMEFLGALEKGEI
ncbi:MAG: NUDIX domain-containing protein [Candidatus Aenigmarchaeota archaeon]|nr:NUDIX domain-containing protein [Candidatus Aenigmarchaeota archaeon]NCO96602.1 NUDIX domain-containing protein [Candidatus Aenigmarchaeota archaeon]NCS70803.1 NUDIX domain-containing protein [Candidatus Aenigmarchaeota archaeon]